MRRMDASRGSDAYKSIRFAPRTSGIVAVSSAKPSRCFWFCLGKRTTRSAEIDAAIASIPPAMTSIPRPLIRADSLNHTAIQEVNEKRREIVMGGEGLRMTNQVFYKVFKAEFMPVVFLDKGRIPFPFDRSNRAAVRERIKKGLIA